MNGVRVQSYWDTNVQVTLEVSCNLWGMRVYVFKGLIRTFKFFLAPRVEFYHQFLSTPAEGHGFDRSPPA